MPHGVAVKSPRKRSSVRGASRRRSAAVEPLLEPALLRDMAAAIADGYRKARRDLPWRRAVDPYAIWVSEIMLQQTRVATVIPYWQRWMARFPTVTALAEAPLDEVLAAWSGLGFYGRARNLHRGAREVLERWAGVLPRAAAELQAVPGIGPYTAGAIASIAYGERAALVDGNVARVFARLFGLEEDIKAPATMRLLWRHAEALMAALPAGYEPGELNQGLMELGATVCGVGEPRCAMCPVASQCAALAAGAQRRLPVSRAGTPQAALPELRLHALWVMRGAQLVLARRKPRGLFGGLWELPSGASAVAVAEAFGAELTGEGAVAHHNQILSHRRLAIDVWLATAPAALGKVVDPSYDAVRYVDVEELPSLAISAATAALYAKYKDTPWTSPPKRSRSSRKATKRSSKV